MTDYTPPEGLKVRISLGGSNYTPPGALQVRINLTPDQAAGEQQYIGGDGFGWDSLNLGTPSIRLNTQIVNGVGAGNTTAFSNAFIRLQYRYVTALSSLFSAYGRQSIANKNRYIKPTALNSNTYGTYRIWNFNFTIKPNGSHFSLFGLTVVQNDKNYINYSGISFTNFGTAKLQNKTTYLKPVATNFFASGKPKLEALRAYIIGGALSSLSIGKPRISYKEQHVIAKQEKTSTLWGNTLIAYAVRYVEQRSSTALTRYGTQWASFGRRYIEPRGVFQQFASNHSIATARTVKMEGVDFLRFGTRIIPVAQVVYPQGITTIFGQNEIHNYRQHIKPKGFLTVGEHVDLRFGQQAIYNLTQYVHAYHGDTSQAIGELFPDIYDHVIYNLNRNVYTHGALHQRFGYQELNNTARVLYLEGMPSPITVGPSQNMVAHRVRYIRAQGLENPYFSTQHIAWLGARVIQHRGQSLSLFGSPHPENTRRIFRFIGMGEQSLFGSSMISHAIRTVRIQDDYGIAPPVIAMPEVKLGIRYVDIKGIDSVRYGWPFVTERFTKIVPRWVVIDRVGEPVIRNRTPSIRMWSFELSEFGQTYIGLFTRHLNVIGLNSQAFSRSHIADSTQQVDLRNYGIVSPTITKLHKIEKIGIGQGVPQAIAPQGIPSPAFPIDDKQWHKVTQNVLRPDSEKSMTLFGKTVVTANTVRVEPGYWEVLIGKPVVTYKNRAVYVDSSKCDFLEIYKPRMSPHTIWAVKEAPQQAIDNHVKSNTRLHYVDGLNVNSIPQTEKEPGIEIGKPKISHKNRRQNIGNYSSILFGEPVVKNILYRIEPVGFNNMRIGVIAPIGDQSIRFRPKDPQTTYGKPSVNHVKERNMRISPGGLNLLVFGKLVIDYFHRFVKPKPFDSMAMGTLLQYDKPYMWQGLRVGAHVPTKIGSDVHSVFGTQWVSLKVREAIMVGDDYSAVGEYEPGYFNLKITIRNLKLPEKPRMQQVFVKGFAEINMGVADIKLKAHYIRPDGNSDNFRKGAF